MTEAREEMVLLSEAENEVKVVTQRLALLHLAYGRILVDNFGWEKGKQLILNAIKEYAKRVAERTKQGHQSLPKYGFWERREGRPPICELGKLVLTYDEMDIGSLYCLVDPAKIMFANPNEKLIHTKCLTVGDEYCEFKTMPTTQKEREDLFGKDKDWSHVDPVLDEFYKKKHAES
jgi:hypothetical protein